MLALQARTSAVNRRANFATIAVSGERLRRGLARLLADDAEALAFFFDDLIVRRYT